MPGARVFVVHENLRFDEASNSWVRSMDFTPAARFGELVFLAPPGRLPGDPAAVIPAMAEALVGITAADYLLPAGDPLAIAWAAALAARRLDGLLTLLRWDGRARAYAPVRTRLWPARLAPTPTERVPAL